MQAKKLKDVYFYIVWRENAASVTLGQFERELISERTLAGLASARARGHKGGAPFKMTPAKLRLAMAAMSHRETRAGDLCRELGITRTTLYRHVAPDGSLREDGKKLLTEKSQQSELS